MKRLLTLAILVSTQAWADSSALDAEFKSLLSRGAVGTVKEQTYCYNQTGTVEGYQPQKLQRIASVTKLLSTLMASETVNLRKTYKTKIYIGKDSLHIEGGKDPYFEEDKLLILFKSLNSLGYKAFKKITFSRDFLFYDLSLEEFAKISPEQTRVRLSSYFNPANKKFIQSQWNVIRKFAREEGMDLESSAPSVSAQLVSISDVNPLLNENPALYVHVSMPLHRILKTMNVQSKNLVAENVYNEASLIKDVNSLLKEKGIDATSFKIYNGSGLPIISKNSRVDNLGSCSMVLKTISLLSQSLRVKHNLKLSDVVAVNGGKDLGSFRTRFELYPDTHEAVISKTGTLKHSSALAGVMLNGKEMPFAILNHTTNPTSARKFQDKFVSRMFDHLGPAVPETYTKISIFPWDGSDFLQPSR